MEKALAVEKKPLLTQVSLLAVVLLLGPVACGPAPEEGASRGGQAAAPGAGDETAAAAVSTEQPAPGRTLARSVSTYDGVSDDLLSAGLGFDGLRGAAPAVNAAAHAATDDDSGSGAAALRRLALYTAYRGLIDLRPEGALAQWQRPDGAAALAPVAGTEILALRQLPGLQHPAAALLQIPHPFDWQQPCLVAAATSGSRGIYGAVPVIAHWALPHGCAVVYSEKGTGNGVYLPASGQGYTVDGQLVAVTDAAFNPVPGEAAARAEHEAYVAQHPHRVAFRHAHSGDNPEAHWGEFLIDAVHFALDELNQRRPQQSEELTAHTTWIIAAGISNGGGAAIAAMEADDQGLFDGAAVAEPNVQVPGASSLYTSSTTADVYAACAIQAVDPQSHPLAAVLAFQAPLYQARCEHLADAGWLQREAAVPLPQQALEKIHAAGYPPAADPLLAFAVAYDLYPAIAATYAHAYGRFPFHQPPCGVGFAFTNAAGEAQPVPAAVAAGLFATSSGVPPTAGIQLVKSDTRGMDKKAALVSSDEAQADGDLNAALCHYRLGHPQTAAVEPAVADAAAQAVAAGIEAVRRSGDLRGRPVFIVHGAADNVVPVAHSSRAYVTLNRAVEGDASRLRYTEIENGQHFDALLALPGYQQRYEGLHGHYLDVLDQLWELRSAGQ